MRFTLARRVPNANRLPRRRGSFLEGAHSSSGGRSPKPGGREANLQRRACVRRASVLLCVRRGTHTENRPGAEGQLTKGWKRAGCDVELRSNRAVRSIFAGAKKRPVLDVAVQSWAIQKRKQLFNSKKILASPSLREWNLKCWRAQLENPAFTVIQFGFSVGLAGRSR